MVTWANQIWGFFGLNGVFFSFISEILSVTPIFFCFLALTFYVEHLDRKWKKSVDQNVNSEQKILDFAASNLQIFLKLWHSICLGINYNCAKFRDMLRYVIFFFSRGQRFCDFARSLNCHARRIQTRAHVENNTKVNRTLSKSHRNILLISLRVFWSILFRHISTTGIGSTFWYFWLFSRTQGCFQALYCAL